MRSMLRAGWWIVLKILKGLTDVLMHVDVDVAFGVIPVKNQTTVVAA